MSNWHCFPSAKEAGGTRLYLDYYRGKGQNSFQSTPSYDCGDLILSDKDLDFALLRCQGSPGKYNGHLKLESRPPVVAASPHSPWPIYMIHQNCDFWLHPNCAPTKKYSPGIVLEEKSEEKSLNKAMDSREEHPYYGQTGPTFNHTADTLNGSSGAPILSPDDNVVIGLHHAGPALSPMAHGRGDKNEAIYMYLIVNAIKKALPELDLSK